MACGQPVCCWQERPVAAGREQQHALHVDAHKLHHAVVCALQRGCEYRVEQQAITVLKFNETPPRARCKVSLGQHPTSSSHAHLAAP